MHKVRFCERSKGYMVEEEKGFVIKDRRSFDEKGDLKEKEA